ncbi:hypothetical protein BHE74_00055568 [Ensete ventricosum]|nr:hypothetical protein BHE74_00055568 [Ensete ventricosum]
MGYSCSHHLIFSSLSLCKSCEIRLEKFRCRDPSEGREKEEQAATASSYAGLATHGQATGKAPCKGAAGCGQGQPAREASTARGGSRPLAHPLEVRHPQRGPAVGRPQGATAHGQPYRQQGQRHRPQGWLPLGRVATDGQGQPLSVQGK